MDVNYTREFGNLSMPYVRTLPMVILPGTLFAANISLCSLMLAIGVVLRTSCFI